MADHSLLGDDFGGVVTRGIGPCTVYPPVSGGTTYVGPGGAAVLPGGGTVDFVELSRQPSVKIVAAKMDIAIRRIMLIPRCT